MRIAKVNTSFSFYRNGLVFKERPRFNTYTKAVYTPKTTKEWELEIGYLARNAMLQKGIDKLNGAIKVTITATCKNIFKKPDIDNIAKIILDALNKIAYKDDARVIELVVKKEPIDPLFSNKAQEEVVVTVEEV